MAKEHLLNEIDNNRIIFMNGDFTETKAEQIITKLLQYECQDPTKDIIMFIDSYGGYVDSFIAIHDIIKLLHCDVATVCIGKAMSCGQMLLMSGTKGKRFITPHSRVLLHEISSWVSGKVTAMEIDLVENKRIQKDVFEKLILKYTKITRKQLDNMLGNDAYMDANKCIELGVVDHIAATSSQLYKYLNI